MISSDFPPISGGQSRYLYDLWSCLPGTGIIIVAPSVPGAAKIDERLSCQVVRVRLPLGRGILSKIVKPLVLGWTVWRLCRRFPVKGIHCGQVLSSGFAAYGCGLLSKIPYFPYVYGSDLTERRNHFLWGVLLRRILARSRKVLVCSTFTAQSVEDTGVEAERIQVLNPSIELSRFTHSGDRRVDVRRRYGWDGRRVILTISRLVERKGHDTVIRALPQIIAEVPDVHYAIGGTGPYRTALEDLAAAQGVSGRVEFSGFVPEAELAAMYAAADVFVMVSRELRQSGNVEGFGIVFLEANAAGTAVLAGRSGGIEDAVVDGCNGLLVDPEDVGAVAAALMRLLEDGDLRARLAAQGMERVKREFDRELRARTLWETCR
jgi:phosphatidylinositol alpha-1,6-mannosyltransferase